MTANLIDLYPELGQEIQDLTERANRFEFAHNKMTCDLVTIRIQRDELLEALQKATDALAGGLWDYGPGQDEHDQCNQVVDECRAAIAKAVGEV